jgi:hypothetical protein
LCAAADCSLVHGFSPEMVRTEIRDGI